MINKLSAHSTLCFTTRGGWGLSLEGGTGMCCSHDSLFFLKASWRSLAYQLTINAPLMCPRCSIFRKLFQFFHFFCIFSLVLAKILVFKMQNFKIFTSKTPHFFKENPLPRRYFWNCAIPTKEKLSSLWFQW